MQKFLSLKKKQLQSTLERKAQNIATASFFGGPKGYASQRSAASSFHESTFDVSPVQVQPIEYDFDAHSETQAHSKQTRHSTSTLASRRRTKFVSKSKADYYVQESEEQVSRSVKMLKKLISETSDSADTFGELSLKLGDNFLLKFLRSCRFDKQEAFATWKAYRKLYSNLTIYYKLLANMELSSRSLATPTDTKNLKMLNQMSGLNTSLNSLQSLPTLRSLKSDASPQNQSQARKGMKTWLSRGKKTETTFSWELPMFEAQQVADCLAAGWIQAPAAFDRYGRQLLFIYPHKFDPASYTTSDICAALMNLFNVLLENEEVQRKGFFIVIDGVNSTQQNIDFLNFKKILFVLQRCLPVVIGSVQLVRLPRYAKALWRSTQTMLKKDMKRRMNFIEANTDDQIGFELEQFIDFTHIPKQYNGSLDWDVDVSMKEWVFNQLL